MSVRAISFFILISFLSQPARAEDAPNAVAENEYDFSWLDPDKKIYVVQNRKYVKKQKLELAISGGLGIGEPYRTRRILLPRAFYYLSESLGVSVFGGFNSNSENSNVAALASVASRIPAVRDIQSMYGASVVWLPFYGKINMFNQILYIDWHFEAGLGQVASEIDLNTTIGNAPRITETSHTSFHWGTGQKFFITRNFAARLDFLAVYYTAPTGVDGDLTSSRGAVEETYDNYFVTLGLSYTF